MEGQHFQGDHEDYGPNLAPKLTTAKGEGRAANLLEEFQKLLRPVLERFTYTSNGGVSRWGNGASNEKSLRGLLREISPGGIYVCKAVLDAIFAPSTWRGGGGQEEAPV
jgi:hypothetical protein